AGELAQVEAALVERGLGDDQRTAVLGILGSGRRGDVLIGPAGSGKSFTVAALAEQWQKRVGGPVVGLATSQIAAQVLEEEGLNAHNIARWLQAYEPDERTGEARATLPAGALLVIDETGMSATDQLDRVRRIAERSGAKLLWTGDHEQLDAVGAGGALRMLARGQVQELGVEDGRRFRAGWEQDASLGLRSGSRE
ncbi:MAG: AAA family ATPase, partial [Pseudonocardiaceae bacterium]|nr:AAA family ATPase [Pseudonocardiaceae bacterium]